MPTGRLTRLISKPHTSVIDTNPLVTAEFLKKAQ